MKKFIYIIVTISISFASLGQQLETQVFVQQTVMGLQKGYGFYLKNEEGWGIGFVQQSLQPFASTEKGRTDYAFSGISTQIPIQNCHKLLLLLTPKVGLVNGQFLAILPEITTSYQLFRNVDLRLGAGLRARKFAVSVAVTYQLF